MTDADATTPRTLSDLGEFEVIRRLLAVRPAHAGAYAAAALDSAADAVVVGAGDDAAILRPRAGYQLVATTDTQLEGVHFDRAWIEAEPLGARVAEVNFSDLAAMAAEPRWALVSYGVRPDHAIDDLVAIQRGLVAALAAHGAVVAGGNLSAVTGGEWLTVTLLGEVATGRAWTRAGARPGDWIAITGRPGRAGVGSALAMTLGPRARDSQWAELVAAWCAPRARVTLALELAAAGGVTAAIDVSDGVSSDLGHLCEASGVGARLEAAAWLGDPVLEAAAAAVGIPTDELRLGASDDYELILAVDPSGREACARIAAAHGVPLTFVGVLTDAPNVLESVGRDGAVSAIEPRGWDHFGRGAGASRE